MTFRIKKLLIIVGIAAVILMANLWAIAAWLDDLGVVGWAQGVRAEYLPGTALTVIGAMLILLGPTTCRVVARRCPVCDHLFWRRGKYCSSCGSRL